MVIDRLGFATSMAMAWRRAAVLLHAVDPQQREPRIAGDHSRHYPVVNWLREPRPLRHGKCATSPADYPAFCVTTAPSMGCGRQPLAAARAAGNADCNLSAGVKTPYEYSLYY